MTDVSTGEPVGRWRAWIKWLRLLAVVLAGIWLARLLDQSIAVLFVLAVVIVVMLVRFRLAEQRLDLLIDGHPVQLNLYTDPSRRVWLESRSVGRLARSCITTPYQQGWLEHALILNGKRYVLRIFVKTSVGAGYLVSNHGRGFDMVVLRNTCAW